MKKTPILLAFFIAISFIACERNFDTDEDTPVSEPLVGKVKEEVFSSFTTYDIIKQKMGDEANFIFRTKQSDQFLLSFMPVYYEENLKSVEWNTSKNSFFFFLDKSNRYKGKNRVAVFKIDNDKPSLLLDFREEQVLSVEYDNNFCVLKLKNGAEKKVKID